MQNEPKKTKNLREINTNWNIHMNTCEKITSHVFHQIFVLTHDVCFLQNLMRNNLFTNLLR